MTVIISKKDFQNGYMLLLSLGKNTLWIKAELYFLWGKL